jgi:hypothetical protein
MPRIATLLLSAVLLVSAAAGCASPQAPSVPPGAGGVPVMYQFTADW